MTILFFSCVLGKGRKHNSTLVDKKTFWQQSDQIFSDNFIYLKRTRKTIPFFPENSKLFKICWNIIRQLSWTVSWDKASFSKQPMRRQFCNFGIHFSIQQMATKQVNYCWKMRELKGSKMMARLLLMIFLKRDDTGEAYNAMARSCWCWFLSIEGVMSVFARHKIYQYPFPV